MPDVAVADVKIDPEFRYNAPSPEQIDTMNQLRAIFSVVASHIRATPAGRYRSLALTALEESSLWANKAITHAEPPVQMQPVIEVVNSIGPEMLSLQITNKVEELMNPTIKAINENFDALKKRVDLLG